MCLAHVLSDLFTCTSSFWLLVINESATCIHNIALVICLEQIPYGPYCYLARSSGCGTNYNLC